MNLTLSEWNKACEYANKVCNALNSKGYNIIVKPYSMWDGRKGIYLQAYDNNGRFFKQFSTGICKGLLEIKQAIDQQAQTILAKL